MEILIVRKSKVSWLCTYHKCHLCIVHHKVKEVNDEWSLKRKEKYIKNAITLVSPDSAQANRTDKAQVVLLAWALCFVLKHDKLLWPWYGWKSGASAQYSCSYENKHVCATCTWQILDAFVPLNNCRPTYYINPGMWVGLCLETTKLALKSVALFIETIRLNPAFKLCQFSTLVSLHRTEWHSNKALQSGCLYSEPAKEVWPA